MSTHFQNFGSNIENYEIRPYSQKDRCYILVRNNQSGSITYNFYMHKDGSLHSTCGEENFFETKKEAMIVILKKFFGNDADFPFRVKSKVKISYAKRSIPPENEGTIIDVLNFNSILEGCFKIKWDGVYYNKNYHLIGIKRLFRNEIEIVKKNILPESLFEI